MNTLAWIVINAVLLGTAAVSVKLAKDLPKELKEEQRDNSGCLLKKPVKNYRREKLQTG